VANRKPDYLKLPYRKAAELEAWLLNGGPKNGGWHKHREEQNHWLFCFDVKLRTIDLSFDHLWEVHFGDNGYAAHDPRGNDPVWREGCRREWLNSVMRTNDVMDIPDIDKLLNDEKKQGKLFDVAVKLKPTIFAPDTKLVDTHNVLLTGAIERACEDFIGGGRGNFGFRPEPGTCWSRHWDGTPVNAEFRFIGRNGGWLALVAFSARRLVDDNINDLFGVADRECYSRFTYEELCWLSEYLLELSHALKDNAPCRRVEEQAAFVFFENFCSDVPSPDENEAQHIRNIASRAAFCRKYIEAGSRYIQKLSRSRGKLNAMSLGTLSSAHRRRVTYIGDLAM
jgi:hypothetical protein